jgi:outer membrane receptor protein involved in Fe transport
VQSPTAWAQLTFRGGINGTVTDGTGAVVKDATVEATEVATNVTQKTITSSAGAFAFPSIAIGKYDVTVAAPGFNKEKFSGVQVSAGVIYTLSVKLTVATSAETVEVSADAYALDTTTTTQTTIIDSQTVNNVPLNGRDFTQLINLTPGFSNDEVSRGSLNGTRINQINWQIDGVDNNDIWHNLPAVNQGGVNSIAGVVLPIDAIEQFSVQTHASAESGRNPGGTVTVGLKSGTNMLHGSAYYYNRNELFGAKNPFADTKEKMRNYNAGFSAGGPIVKDHLFTFINYEHQRFLIGVSEKITEPTDVWQQYASDIVTSNGKQINSISTNLLTLLWPSYALTSSAAEKSNGPQVNNYNSLNPEWGYSHNGVIKVDYTINERNSISAHWFGGQGVQTAPSGSDLLPYYQINPTHIYNYQLTYNHTFTPSLTNQIVSGVNYFKQSFDDNKTGFDVAGTGLITGSSFSNAPELKISNFDATGTNPPMGRVDVSGQISDNLSWVKGKHEMKFGGEYRHVQLDEFYHRNAQGVYNFNGSEAANNGLTSGWDFSKSTLASGVTDSSVIARLNSLADYLAGYVHTGAITTGDPERTVYVNTFAAFAQDSYQLTRKLNINFGLRYDYQQPFHDSKKDLSAFRPDIVSTTGLAVQGDQVSSLYDSYYTSFSPRIGLSYQAAPHTVLRAGGGLYYDTPNLNPFLDNRPGNGAPNGVESNPAGTSQVTALYKTSYIWESNVNQLETSSSTGIFSIQKDFHPSYNLNYNLQLEQSITPSVIAQIGYVGSEARHQISIIDINQSKPNATGVDQTSRPYYIKYANYSNINDVESIGNANYNSLQATLRASNIRRFSGQLAYTWSKSLDDLSSYRGALPQDSTNFKGDYGLGDFDCRENFVGELSYQIPGSAHWKNATTGWQVNGNFAFHTGFPFTVLTDKQTDHTGENNQRANQISDPYIGYKKAAVNADWLNPNAFANPAAGTWGTSRRNEYTAPGFGDVDLSVFKDTKIGQRVNAQFRVELYNLYNRTNYAPPLSGGNGASGGYNPNQSTISSLQLADTIGDFNGAPGIGFGEPFNTQFALKLTF